MAHKQKSFTLIEMLIVVVIIGILAAALIPRLQSVQARARDTKRKADLHQIATALEIYKEDNWNYKGIQMWWGMSVPLWTTRDLANQVDDPQWFVAATNTLNHYMTSVPLEPQQTFRYPWNTDHFVGYLLHTINIHTASYVGGRDTFDWFLLAARTESDGSSSNWVTNTSYYNDAPTTIVTWYTNGTRWWCLANGWDYVDVYNENICTKVTYDSGTTNIAGTCTADKNADDTRYIYVQ